MQIDEFQAVNATRGRRWHQGDLSQWTLAEWTNALCGEAGEAANVAKKLRRLDLQLPNKEAGLTRDDAEPLRAKLANECGDTIIYALLILSVLGVNASDVIAGVFDQKSIEYGFPERARDRTTARDPEQWPCTFSHHAHGTRQEAIECVRKR